MFSHSFFRKERLGFLKETKVQKMEVYCKIRFGSERNKIESFGNWRYLVYTTLKESDPNLMNSFLPMLARFLGVPPNKVRSIGKKGDMHVFEAK